MGPRFELCLFVAGRSPNSQRAIRNLEEICREYLADECDVEVVDVLEHPQRAEQERILATPTLVKKSPPPKRRIVGDLSDRELVVAGLALTSRDREPGGPARESRA